MDRFLLAFTPLFVAIDVVGVLPLFVGHTEGMEERRIRKLIAEAIGAAVPVSIIFLVGGKMIFSFPGITGSDFRVGVVPLGIPLIMGPAALTTILLLVDSYGYLWTILSLRANMAIVWAAFFPAPWIAAALGEGGARVVAKMAALLLAGIAPMMVRSGIAAMIGGT